MGKSYRYNEYEREFYNDVRGKKRTASGVYHRASRRGYVGSVKTQSDYLTAKEKRKLNGEVKVTNMYDKYKDLNNLPKKKELVLMSKENPEELKKILEMARKHNSTIAIHKAIGIASGTLYNIYDRIGLQYNKGVKGGNIKALKKDAVNNIPPSDLDKKDTSDFDKMVILKETLDSIKSGVDCLINKNPSEKKNEFCVSVSIEADKQKIEDRILALSSILLDGVKYKFTLKIEEIDEV